MAIMQKGSPYVKVIHSMSKYFGYGSDDLNGKIIAFHGERSQNGDPMPVLPPPKALWEWKEVQVVNNDALWAAWLANPGNEHKLWDAPAANRTAVSLPKGLWLPPVLAQFALEKPRTLKEMFEKTVDLLVAEDSVLEDVEISLARQWFLAAGQQAGAHESLVSVTLNAIMASDAAFVEWQQKHLESQIGIWCQPQQVPPQWAGGNDEMAKSFGLMAKLLQQNHAAAVQREETKKEKKGEVTAFQVARMCGWAGVRCFAQLPPLWHQLVKERCRIGTPVRSAGRLRGRCLRP